MPLLLRDVNSHEPSSSNAQRISQTAKHFVDCASPLRIRNGYVCTSLAEAKTLLEEAATILGAFAKLERISVASTETNEAVINAASLAFLTHPITLASIATPSRPQADQSTSLPDYGAIAEAHDRPVDAPAADLDSLLSLNRELLESYFWGIAEAQVPADDMRTAVARALLTAAGGAMEAAIGYLTHVFDVGTVQVLAAYVDGGGVNESKTQAPDTEALFNVTSRIDTFAQRLPILMITGNDTLTSARNYSAPKQAMSSGAHGDSAQPLPLVAVERKRQISQWLQLKDLTGYVSEFNRPLNLEVKPPAPSDFHFATQGVAELSGVLVALDTPNLAAMAHQLTTLRASRTRRARREEAARERALSVSIVDPDRPLSLSGIKSALGYLADEPGESGLLTIDCEANARIKLVTAKLGGSIRMSYMMSNWGVLLLGIEAGASARLGIGASIADAGIKGEVGITCSKKFTSHDDAARFVYGSLRNWVETLSREIGPTVWNYLHFDDAKPINPDKLGSTLIDTKRAAAADASGKLGSTKLGGSLGRTVIDRHTIEADGKESRAQIAFNSASVFGSAKVGNLAVGVDAHASLGDWLREGQDTPFQFMSLGAGIDLTFSGGFGENSAWENSYNTRTKNNIAKAVGKSLERVREFLTATFPTLAASPSLTRKAWKSLRKEVIAEIDKGAKSAKSAKIQFKLAATFAREARGTTDVGELDTNNNPYALNFIQLMLLGSHHRSTGVNAKLFGVSGNTTVSKSESVRIWLGDHSMSYCKTLYKTSGSKPGAPKGHWKQLLEQNPSEPFEAMYGAVWNEGKGPIGVGSAGENFFELFLRMKEDELVRTGTVRLKIRDQAGEYLALLERCLEQCSDDNMPDLGTIAELDFM